ncbi:MAG: prepilin-type N-terminal cleavage/methylation domain-containing protein [Candidatus Omnitrophota bacterium]
MGFLKHTEQFFSRKPPILTRGFTLIELLIASLIFSIIILSVYSSFHTGILSYNKIDSAFNIYQTARIILNRMELEIKNSFAYGKDDSKFKGDNQYLSFFTVLDSFNKEAAEFYSDIYRVQYKSDGAIVTHGCLKGLNALKEDQADAEINSELSSNIKKVSFAYASPITDTPENPYEWQDFWPKTSDTDQQKSLPLAVKITLSLAEKDKRDPQQERIIEFIRIVSLPR